MHHRHLLQQQPRFLVIIVFEVVVIIKRVGEQTKLLGVGFEFVVGGWMKYGFFFFNLFFFFSKKIQLYVDSWYGPILTT